MHLIVNMLRHFSSMIKPFERKFVPFLILVFTIGAITKIVGFFSDEKFLAYPDQITGLSYARLFLVLALVESALAALALAAVTAFEYALLYIGVILFCGFGFLYHSLRIVHNIGGPCPCFGEMAWLSWFEHSNEYLAITILAVMAGGSVHQFLSQSNHTKTI